MSECIILCCDICNKNQEISGRRGYTYLNRETAIEWGWKSFGENDEIMCLDCAEDH